MRFLCLVRIQSHGLNAGHPGIIRTRLPLRQLLPLLPDIALNILRHALLAQRTLLIHEHYNRLGKVLFAEITAYLRRIRTELRQGHRHRRNLPPLHKALLACGDQLFFIGITRILLLFRLVHHGLTAFGGRHVPSKLLLIISTHRSLLLLGLGSPWLLLLSVILGARLTTALALPLRKLLRLGYLHHFLRV